MKQEKNNKKKKRLLVALLMLVVSIVAFTTATYAWFSANRVVTTSGIDVKVTAATGISISADALDFGKEINMDDIIKFAKDTTFASTLQLPEELNPVSTNGVTGTNTDFQFVRGELGENEEVVMYTNSELKKDFKTTEGKENFTGGDYIAFDVYIKSSQDLNLKLADTTAINALTDAGTGNLETGLRIGFLPLGVTKDTSLTGQQTSAYNLAKVQEDWKIWNPVPGTHHAATLDGYAEGDSEETKGYYGANSATTAIEGLNTKGEAADTDNHFVHYLYKDVNKETDTYLTLFDSTNANYIQGLTYADTVFSVKAGINKVRVYIWLEGNDVDCVDAISISNGLKVALGFEVA